MQAVGPTGNPVRPQPDSEQKQRNKQAREIDNSGNLDAKISDFSTILDACHENIEKQTKISNILNNDTKSENIDSEKHSISNVSRDYINFDEIFLENDLDSCVDSIKEHPCENNFYLENYNGQKIQPKIKKFQKKGRFLVEGLSDVKLVFQSKTKSKQIGKDSLVENFSNPQLESKEASFKVNSSNNFVSGPKDLEFRKKYL